jgi:hypothetical protein
MRKLETENISPESESPLEIRDRNAGVIRGNDAEGHISENFNAQRRTSNSEKVDRPLRRAMSTPLGFADIF